MHLSIITACKITWKEESLPPITKEGCAFSQKESCIALSPESLSLLGESTVPRGSLCKPGSSSERKVVIHQRNTKPERF